MNVQDNCQKGFSSNLFNMLKPSSHCPGLAPRYAPDGGPGDTVLNREDYRGGTLVNRDTP